MRSTNLVFRSSKKNNSYRSIFFILLYKHYECYCLRLQASPRWFDGFNVIMCYTFLDYRKIIEYIESLMQLSTFFRFLLLYLRFCCCNDGLI